MDNNVKVTFKHWKSGDELSVTGKIVPWMNENSDRIIVEKDDGVFEDIIKDTIVSIEDL
jgi:hypothetical protein